MSTTNMSHKQQKIQRIKENKDNQKKLAQENRRDNIIIVTKPIEKIIPQPEKKEKIAKHLKKYNDKEMDDDMFSAYM